MRREGALIAVLAGSSECLWDDYERAKEIIGEHDVFCVNHTALYWPGNFKGVISIHAEIFTVWFIAQVRAKGAFTVSCRLGADKYYSPRQESLDSGLLGARYLNDRYDQVVLCGIPLDSGRKFYERYDAKSQLWQDNIFQAWKDQKEFLNNCRSMSGKTMTLLGEVINGVEGFYSEPGTNIVG